MCILFCFKFFFQLICISLVPLISPYSAQILLANALFYRQNARLKNRLFCSKFCRKNLSKPTLRWKHLAPSREVYWKKASTASIEILAVRNLERFKCTFQMFCYWITGITTVSFRKLVSVVWPDHCKSETTTPNESDELLTNIQTVIQIKISVKIPRQKVQKVFSSLVPSLQQ